MANIFIYGAYGYTGKLVTEVAVARGLKPLLGGRHKGKLQKLAGQYDLPYRVLQVDDQPGWEQVLADIGLVLNCAGPFELTVHHIVPLCLQQGVHYLDITGEIAVFSYIATLDQQARDRQVTLMPGVGFDIVPTDCLAAMLKERLPDGHSLQLAFQGNSGISRGTALSMIRKYHEGGLIRKDGELVRVPIAYEVKKINFGGHQRLCVSIPWGDVFTAYYTTGIPNIRVYTGVSPKMLKQLLAFKKLSWAARTAVMQWLMQRLIRQTVKGPSPEQRQQNITWLWGQIKNKEGQQITLEMQTMESYQLTAHTAIAAAIKVLDGQAQPGFITPAAAFGADFIRQFDKTKVKEIHE